VDLAGRLLRAEIAFVARDVPAMGHAVYRLIPRGAPGASAPAPPESPVIENEHYRMEFDPIGGVITRLLVKAGNWEALRGPANVVVLVRIRAAAWSRRLACGVSRCPHQGFSWSPPGGAPATLLESSE